MNTLTDPDSLHSLLNHSLHLQFDVVDQLTTVDLSHLRLHQEVILQHTTVHTE